MSTVYLLGSYSTTFGKKPDQSFKDLTREAYLNVLADAGLETGSEIEFAYFGNCGMYTWGQGSIRGQVCTIELVDEGLFPARVPIINVEGACATASMAFHCGWKDILSGQSDLVLAVGVEKTYVPGAETNPEARKRMFEFFQTGIDNFDKQRLWDEYARVAGAAGSTFEPGENRTIFMDTYAIQARYHMKRYGTTQRQIAVGAAKNHNYGALNPKAQYRFELSPDQVLADRVVSYPLTRSMCAPIGDGAAAALLCSERYLRGQPKDVQQRAVRVKASVLAGGKYRALDEASVSHTAAKRAYELAGVGPKDIHVAEVHDATSFCEVYQAEMLGFCDLGQGGSFVESGATGPEGVIRINTSGGLVSKGHPVGATGLSMIYELVTQLRGEAGKRQVSDARIALQENGGGVIGLEEAACSIVILESGV